MRAADRPNSKWVTDISYIHTKQGVLYLSMIRDLYDNSIVACKTGTQQSVNSDESVSVAAVSFSDTDDAGGTMTAVLAAAALTGSVVAIMQRAKNAADTFVQSCFFTLAPPVFSKMGKLPKDTLSSVRQSIFFQCFS